jgi:membrane protease YdiL (CAAX protease family)
MNQKKQFFTRYRFTLFFLLAYLLSWWTMLPRLGLFPYGPTLAGIVVIALTLGRAGLREFWGRVTNFRGGRWYLVGPAILAIGLVAAFGVNVLLGAPVSAPPQLPLIAVGLLLLLGGEWEEPGWTGYALPALQRRYAKTRNGPLIATLILGIFRALWHLPLVIVGAIPWYEGLLMNVLVFQPIISWLYNKSKGSVPAVMVFHFMSNLLSVIVSPLFVGSEKVQYTILFYVFGFVAALVIAVGSGFKFGWRGADEQPAVRPVVDMQMYQPGHEIDAA